MWPVQPVLVAVAAVAVVLAIRRSAAGGRIISGFLALLWLWMGVVYHLIFFWPINPAAAVFGAACIVQGGLFAVYGVVWPRLTFAVHRDLRGILGAAFIAYALVVYPLLGWWLGHRYPEAPTFGLPCPTTIFTFGMLLWSKQRVPAFVLVIPALWSLVGTSAAVSLGIAEDYGLGVAGLVGTLVLLDPTRIAPGRGGPSTP